MNVVGVILAAGRGVRVGKDIPKQFIKVGEKEIWEYSVEAIVSAKMVNITTLVVPETWIKHVEEHIKRFEGKFIVIKGGKSRQDSVYKALVRLRKSTDDSDIVVLHDAVRPLVSREAILRCIEAAFEYRAATLGIKAADTMVRTTNNVIESIVSRENLYHIQTPQCFTFGLIYEAHREALQKGVSYTDDATMVTKELGVDVRVVDGERFNIKVTTPEDLEIVRAVLGS